jgi:hypothetical protein
MCKDLTFFYLSVSSMAYHPSDARLKGKGKLSFKPWRSSRKEQVGKSGVRGYCVWFWDFAILMTDIHKPL